MYMQMQINTCLLVLLNQSRAKSSKLVSSLSANEHFYFGWGLFESDLLLQFPENPVSQNVHITSTSIELFHNVSMLYDFKCCCCQVYN